MPKKNNPETLALAMDYAAAMEACAAYVQVSQPLIREPDAVYKVVRPIIDAATGGDKQESFMVLLLGQGQAPLPLGRGVSRARLVQPSRPGSHLPGQRQALHLSRWTLRCQIPDHRPPPGRGPQCLTRSTSARRSCCCAVFPAFSGLVLIQIRRYYKRTKIP